jgi:iron(II)-dependent oxidoreductase
MMSMGAMSALTCCSSEHVRDARARSLELITDLCDAELSVPYLPTINPLLWEVCHAAYFQEYWVLRRGAGREPLRPDSDALFDSITIAHEDRWNLAVPDREECLAYVTVVRDGVLELLEKGVEDERVRYFIEYSVYHEDMHTEAITCTRQALGCALPELDVATGIEASTEAARGDAPIEGGTHLLGARRGSGFCFDNEKWAHPVEVKPFRISKTAVSEGELAAFVGDSGYTRPELWSEEGWAWVRAEKVELPLYWRRSPSGEFERRHFDRWSAIDPTRAMQHLSWYEADAFARWAGRRLPTEAEWEMAAATRNAETACFDWRGGGPVDVNAFAGADTPEGCRQMMGNVWEWTSTTFAPYPDFVPDMYEDYSQTSFHTRKVLRGGSWATRARTMRPSLRNFFQPSRRDVFSGLRTCALDA